MENKMITIWISGVTASGKTTLAKELYKKLKTTSEKDFRFLDGEDLRSKQSRIYGHSVEERMKLIHKYIEFIKEENKKPYVSDFCKWSKNN